MSNVCLALNASYEPLTIMPMTRALRLVLQGKAVAVEADSDRPIKASKTSMPRPLVIRLVKYVHVPRRLTRKVTNTFLFARDGYRCAYCGRHEKDLGKREGLNRDHIIPQSKGGPNTWANCVTACSRCNSLKADRSLAEFTEATGLRLRVKPREPGLVELKWTVRKLSPIQRHYIEQFYGADTLEALGGNEEVS